jgi:hypothetical protein
MDPRGNTPDPPSEEAPEEGQLSATDRMRRAIAAAADGTGASDAFQPAARELVSEWRRTRVPPEQIILRIKKILVDIGLRPSYVTPPGPQAGVDTQTEVYREVIAWTIRHYYETASADG